MPFRKIQINVRIIGGRYRHKHIFINAVENFIRANVIARHAQCVNKISWKQVVVKHSLFVEGIDKNIRKRRRRHTDISCLIEQIQNFSYAVVYSGWVFVGVVGVY